MAGAGSCLSSRRRHNSLYAAPLEQPSPLAPTRTRSAPAGRSSRGPACEGGDAKDRRRVRALGRASGKTHGRGSKERRLTGSAIILSVLASPSHEPNTGGPRPLGPGAPTPAPGLPTDWNAIPLSWFAVHWDCGCQFCEVSNDHRNRMQAAVRALDGRGEKRKSHRNSHMPSCSQPCLRHDGKSD
jgi:hypothetical protein